MTGVVNDDLEPLVRLVICDTNGDPLAVDVVVDTGFNGFLTLPPEIIDALDLPWLCRQQAQLADGSILAFDVHTATVSWHGDLRIVEVEAADAQPLLGMALLQGSDLHIHIAPNGMLTIEVSL